MKRMKIQKSDSRYNSRRMKFRNLSLGQAIRSQKKETNEMGED